MHLPDALCLQQCSFEVRLHTGRLLSDSRCVFRDIVNGCEWHLQELIYIVVPACAAALLLLTVGSSCLLQRQEGSDEGATAQS